MISIRKLGDVRNNSVLSVREQDRDRKWGWELSLTTADLPEEFSNLTNPSLNLAIIDLNDILTLNQKDTMCLPVILTGIIRGDSETKFFYRQKSNEVGSLSPMLNLDGYFSVPNADAHVIERPFLKIQFLTDQSGMLRGEDLQQTTREFNGTQDDTTSQGLDAREREHVDKGENANGGLDLAVGEKKNDQAESERENTNVYQSA